MTLLNHAHIALHTLDDNLRVLVFTRTTELWAKARDVGSLASLPLCFAVAYRAALGASSHRIRRPSPRLFMSPPPSLDDAAYLLLPMPTFVLRCQGLLLGKKGTGRGLGCPVGVSERASAAD